MAADAHPNFLNWPGTIPIHSPGLARQTEHLSPFRRAYHVIIASVYFRARVVFHVSLLCQSHTKTVVVVVLMWSAFVVLLYRCHSCSFSFVACGSLRVISESKKDDTFFIHTDTDTEVQTVKTGREWDTDVGTVQGKS